MAQEKGEKEFNITEKKSTHTLFDCFINKGRKKNTKLDAIDMMIKWSPITKQLKKALQRTANAVGIRITLLSSV